MKKIVLAMALATLAACNDKPAQGNGTSQDNNTENSDSLAKADSIARADSLVKADSTARADSIAKELSIMMAMADSAARADSLLKLESDILVDKYLADYLRCLESIREMKKDGLAGTSSSAIKLAEIIDETDNNLRRLWKQMTKEQQEGYRIIDGQITDELKAWD